jgi:hypothetical protein
MPYIIYISHNETHHYLEKGGRREGRGMKI